MGIPTVMVMQRGKKLTVEVKVKAFLFPKFGYGLRRVNFQILQKPIWALPLLLWVCHGVIDLRLHEVIHCDMYFLQYINESI